MKMLIVTVPGMGYDEWDRWQDTMPHGMELAPLWAEGLGGMEGVVMEAPLLTSTYTGLSIEQIGQMDAWGRIGANHDAVSWENVRKAAVWNLQPWRWELAGLPFTWPADMDIGGFALPGMPFGDPFVHPNMPLPEGWPASSDLAMNVTNPDPTTWTQTFFDQDMGETIQRCAQDMRKLVTWYTEQSMDPDIGWVGFTFAHRLFQKWNRDDYPTWDSVSAMVREALSLLLIGLGPERLMVYSPWGWEPGGPTRKGFVSWSGFGVNGIGALAQYDIARIINDFLATQERPEKGLFRDAF